MNDIINLLSPSRIAILTIVLCAMGAAFGSACTSSSPGPSAQIAPTPLEPHPLDGKWLVDTDWLASVPDFDDIERDNWREFAISIEGDKVFLAADHPNRLEVESSTDERVVLRVAGAAGELRLVFAFTDKDHALVEFGGQNVVMFRAQSDEELALANANLSEAQRQTETTYASIVLTQIGKLALAHLAQRGGFPTATAACTPATRQGNDPRSGHPMWGGMFDTPSKRYFAFCYTSSPDGRRFAVHAEGTVVGQEKHDCLWGDAARNNAPISPMATVDSAAECTVERMPPWP